MQVNVVVELGYKEIVDAIIEAAKGKVKDNSGSSTLEFLYEQGHDGKNGYSTVNGARVKFQY